MAKIQEVGKALLGVLKDSDLHDVAAPFADSGAAVAAAGIVAKNIPVVSTLVGLSRVGSTISDQILAQNCMSFSNVCQIFPMRSGAVQ